MPDLKTPIETTPVPEGMLYQPEDYTLLQAVIDNTTNGLIDALGGPNFLPTSNSVTITPAISGMSVTIGGTGQYMIAQGRILDVCPSTTITFAASGGASDRVDLIAVKATRVNGSQTITRNVRADGATPAFITLTGTLASGSATVALPSGYTVAPTITGVTPIGLDVAGKVDLVSVNTAQAVFQSSDSTDSRQFSFNVTGTPTGYAGIPTVITQQENQPLWAYVEGTNTTPPSPPSGYDSFATVYVHAFETSISSNDITYLFPTLISPVADLVAKTLTLTSTNGITLPNGVTIKVDGSGNLLLNTPSGEAVQINHNATIAGTLGVTGNTTLAVLAAAATTLASLAVTAQSSAAKFLANEGAPGTGGYCFSEPANDSGLFSLADGDVYLYSNGSPVLKIDGTLLAHLYGAVTIAGTLGVTGAATLSSSLAALSLAITNGATVGGDLAVTGNISGSKRINIAEGGPSGPGGYTFVGEAGNDTGMFSASDGDLYFLINNALALHFAATIDAVFSGSVTATEFFGSGAGLNAGSVPTAALASIPVGGVVYKDGPHVANTQTQTITLDAALPAGSWRVTAHANFNMNGAQTVTLAGADGGTTWETTQSTNDTDQPNSADLWLTGTATGGNQPSITLASSIASPYTGYLGIIDIMCVRTS